MILPLILTAIWAVLATFICYIQVKRSNNLEQIANNLVQNMEEISNIISSSKELLESEQIKTAFSSDDEVGSFFKNLEEIQDILNNFILNSDAKES